MLYRIAIASPHGFPHLTRDQGAKGIRKMRHCIRTQISHDPGCLSKKKIASENRHGIIPAGVGAGHTPALVCLIHHIIVVQGSQVNHFHHHSRLHHPIGLPMRPELRRKQGKHGAESFTARDSQVLDFIGNKVLASRQFSTQQLLDLAQSVVDCGGELWVA